MYDDKYDADKDIILDPTFRFEDMMTMRLNVKVEDSLVEVEVVLGVAVGCFSITLVMIVVLLIILWVWYRDLFKNRALLPMFLVVMTTIVVIVVMLSVVVTQDFALDKAYQDELEYRILAEQARNHTDFLTGMAREFVQFGDVRAYHQYWELIHSGRREKVEDDLQDIGITDHEAQLMAQSKAQSDALVATETIAMVLTMTAWSIHPAKMSEVKDFPWDAKLEPTYMDDLDNYPNRVYTYSNRDLDLSLDNDTMKLIARHIMFDDKYFADKHKIWGPIVEAVGSMDDRSQLEVIRITSLGKALITVVIALALVFFVEMIILVYILLTEMLSTMNHFLATAMGDRIQEGFGSMMRSSCATLCIILALQVVGLVFTVVYVSSIRDGCETLNLATWQEALVSRSMYLADDLVTSGGIGGVLTAQGRKIMEAHEELIDVYDVLRGASVSGMKREDSHISSLHSEWLLAISELGSLVNTGAQDTLSTAHDAWIRLYGMRVQILKYPGEYSVCGRSPINVMRCCPQGMLYGV